MKTKTSTTTKRLQSIAKHVNTMLNISTANDILFAEAAKFSRRTYLSDAEYDMWSATNDAVGDVTEGLYCIKSAERSLDRAARIYYNQIEKGK